MAIDYIKTQTATLTFKSPGGSQASIELLWGDEVKVLKVNGATATVKARGIQGELDKKCLGGEPLLEVYFIDVGQGDGILICTPDRKHILIDAGFPRNSQPTGKNAADFVDWKFFKDYGLNTITLDAMIASHNDADHYGGLADLLNPAARNELDTSKVVVKNFNHAGVSWWKSSSGRTLGKTVKHNGKEYLVQLLGDRTDLQNNAGALQGMWGDFLNHVLASGCKVERLSHLKKSLPGFPKGPVKIHVLGPIEEEAPDNIPALRKFKSDSINTNGHSVLLRLDYGRTRILLTGDLNSESQRLLLEAFKGKRSEFAADVVKSCHHSSDDCSYEFLETVGAAATVISSGDNENHAHPRPSIVAASALTGHKRIDKDRIVTPLIFSTEISRSLRIAKVTGISDKMAPHAQLNLSNYAVEAKETAAGALNGTKRIKKLDGSYIVTGVIYGLVNVRTDGQTILCATMNENKKKWDIKEFESRF